jgi:putative transposase
VVKTPFNDSAHPESKQTATSAWNGIQIGRQVYNHALTQEYKPAPQHDKPSYTTVQNKLPEWKDKWAEWKTIHSKALQMTVRRIKTREKLLDGLKERGYNVSESSGKHRESIGALPIISLALTWIVTRARLVMLLLPPNSHKLALFS